MAEVRVVWRGKRLNMRTVAMVQEAERICPGTFAFSIVQGSYNAGGVSASAGTHDGGGAVDVSGVSISDANRKAVELAMRKVGFAAWIRSPAQGNWGWHIHGIAIGDDDMSSGAAYQVREYKAGGDGLVGSRADTGPRGYAGVTWESYKAAHKVVEEIEMTVGTDILAVVKRIEGGEAARYKAYMGQFANIDRKLTALSVDLKNLSGAESGRYADYVRRFDSILAEIAKLPKT